jgi:hypothetical protein
MIHAELSPDFIAVRPGFLERQLHLLFVLATHSFSEAM